MGSYIVLDDIRKAISADTLIALYDDDNTGDLSDPTLVANVNSVIERAEAEVNSYLMRAYPKLTLPVAQTPLSATLKQAALRFAIPYSYMRHPEYVRTYGDDPRGGVGAEQGARDFMERVCTGQQYLFDVPAEPKPSTVGGVTFSGGPYTMIDSPDGCRNGGDF